MVRRRGRAAEGSTLAQVSFDGVTKRFGDVTAVDDLTLHVADGELLVLLGSSGCGKTTALRLVAGLEDLNDGTVTIGARVVNDVDPKDRDVAMVFQSYALYPHLTVAKNIEFPLRQRGVDRETRATKVKRASETLGLGALLDRKPVQLSGGQRQRVALARAIVREPLVFLMDEPLSNLDAALRVQTRADIVELQARLATTTLYVTHDQVEAMTMGNRIAVMSDGKLQQVAPPEDLYARPANAFVAHFLGSPGMNLVEGMLVESGAPDVEGGDRRGTLCVAFPGASVPLPPGGGRRRARVGARRRAGPAARGAAPEPRRRHRGERHHRRAARRRDARHLLHRDRRPHHRAPERIGDQAQAGRGRAHRRGPRPGLVPPLRRRRRGPAGRRAVTAVTTAPGPGPAPGGDEVGPPGEAGSSNTLRSRRRRQALLAYLLLLPALVLFGVFSFYPFLRNFKLMLYESAPVPGLPSRYVGLHQIIPTITSTQFTQSLVTTLLFVVLVVPIGLLAGLALAVVAHRKLKGMAVYRVIFSSTVVSSVAVASVVFGTLLNPVVGLLPWLGINPNPPALESTTWALPSVALITIWQFLGLVFIIMSAGLQSVPDELIEAARIDGAGPWTRFWRMTVPLLSPTIFFAGVVSTIYAFQAFGAVDILIGNQSAVRLHTNVFIYNIINTLQIENNTGEAAIMAIVLFLILLVLTLLQLRLLERRVNYAR